MAWNSGEASDESGPGWEQDIRDPSARVRPETRTCRPDPSHRRHAAGSGEAGRVEQPDGLVLDPPACSVDSRLGANRGSVPATRDAAQSEQESVAVRRSGVPAGVGGVVGAIESS